MYDADYFATVDNSYKNFDILRFKTVVDTVSCLGKGLICLDAGSGRGHYLDFLSGRFQKAIGLEYSKAGIRGSKKTVSKNPFLINGSLLENLPFKDSSFDFILCSETLEHLEKLDKVLSELSRVLKSTGKLLVTVPNFTKLSFEYIREIVSYKDPTHIHRYPFSVWGSILSRHFKIEKVSSSSYAFSFPLFYAGLSVSALINIESIIRKIPILKELGRECIFILSKN